MDRNMQHATHSKWKMTCKTNDDDDDDDLDMSAAKSAFRLSPSVKVYQLVSKP